MRSLFMFIKGFLWNIVSPAMMIKGFVEHPVAVPGDQKAFWVGGNKGDHLGDAVVKNKGGVYIFGSETSVGFTGVAVFRPEICVDLQHFLKTFDDLAVFGGHEPFANDLS